jgi:hypothetical protein
MKWNAKPQPIQMIRGSKSIKIGSDPWSIGEIHQPKATAAGTTKSTTGGIRTSGPPKKIRYRKSAHRLKGPLLKTAADH